MSIESWSIAAATLLALTGTAQAATTNGFANGGFETVGVSTAASSWLAAAAGYTRSTDAHSGSFSAQLASPRNNAAAFLQNSLEQGGLPPLTAGDVPVLSFWAMGFQGTTGDVTFSLRYLNATGSILANSLPQHFGGLINRTTWTQVTYTLPGGVPAGAVAAFIEFRQTIGDIDIFSNNLAGKVLIDDVNLAVATVPEPGTSGLLLAGLVTVGAMARRRRSA